MKGSIWKFHENQPETISLSLLPALKFYIFFFFSFVRTRKKHSFLFRSSQSSLFFFSLSLVLSFSFVFLHLQKKKNWDQRLKHFFPLLTVSHSLGVIQVLSGVNQTLLVRIDSLCQTKSFRPNNQIQQQKTTKTKPLSLICSLIWRIVSWKTNVIEMQTSKWRKNGEKMKHSPNRRVHRNSSRLSIDAFPAIHKRERKKKNSEKR